MALPPGSTIRVLLVGAVDIPLRQLIGDALSLGAGRCELVDGGTVDVVLAVVPPGHASTIIAAARGTARRTPVLAILPRADEDLALHVLECGAQAWFPLDGPLDLLRAMVIVFGRRGSALGVHAN